jgi:hypothetical protein
LAVWPSQRYKQVGPGKPGQKDDAVPVTFLGSIDKSGPRFMKSMGFGPQKIWTQLDWASLDVDANWTSCPIPVDTYGHQRIGPSTIHLDTHTTHIDL